MKIIELKNDINNNIEKLINLSKKYNPIELIYGIKIMEMKPIFPEGDSDTLLITPDHRQGNLLEYMVSLLTAFPLEEFSNEDINEKIIHEIMKIYDEIDKYVLRYSFELTRSDEYKLKYGDGEIEYIISNITFSNVRGKRYKYFEMEHYKKLFSEHEEEIKKLFNINEKDFYNGLASIAKISLGNFIEGMMQLRDEMESYKMGMDTSEDTKKKIEKTFTSKGFIIDSDEVWNNKLLESLTLSFGENTDFYKGKYAGWPINNSLLIQRPILKANNEYYCFNHYNLTDNFYRMLYKAIVREDELYKQTWQEKQKDSTEEYVATLFKKIFKKSMILKGNYFFPNGTRNRRSENDLIILFEDTIFIIEVKSGSYTPDNPIIDFNSHKKTIVDLMEKPDEQCLAMLSYLSDYSDIYDVDNNVKSSINLEKYNQIYMMSFSLENFNEIANSIEKYENIKFTRGNFLISIDDFRIYSDYFESQPYFFLDYMKYRKKAIEHSNLNVYDEIDHLGMYIEMHDYPQRLNDIVEDKGNSNTTRILYDGARDKLDEYYDSKQTPIVLEKPRPVWLNSEYIKFLSLLDRSNLNNKGELINGLFDILKNTDVKSLTDVFIKFPHGRYLEDIVNTSFTINGFEVNFTYLNIKNNKIIKEEMKLRCLAKLKRNKLKKCFIVYFIFDRKKRLVKINLECINDFEIETRNQKKLDKLSRELFNKRKQLILEKYNLGKLDDDMPCPCGSNKSYLLCCKAIDDSI